MTEWHLAPGERIKRTELHRIYGGSGQGGINPSATTPNVFLFSDPPSGHQYGYIDEWAEDGTFRYAGEGQTGDQRVNRGNLAVVRHVVDRRALRLFWGSRGTVTYAGEFVLDPGLQFSTVRRPGRDGVERNALLFYLRPVLEPLSPVVEAPLGTAYRPADEEAEFAPPTLTESDAGDAYGRGSLVHRRLQNRLAKLAEANDFAPLSPSPAGPDFDVAWLDATDTLVIVEVKSVTDSNEIRQLRMGLGQVLDYRSMLDGCKVKPVLYVERRPRDPRWERLTELVGVVLCWPGHEERIGLRVEEAGPGG